ncbi:hypothetical protein GCM10020218_034690 [Dactylosporangium vinaceum]
MGRGGREREPAGQSRNACGRARRLPSANRTHDPRDGAQLCTVWPSSTAHRSARRHYERNRPGELIHVDVKKIGRPRVGYDYIHAAIADHTRLAYAEIHPAGFLHRAAAHGIPCIDLAAAGLGAAARLEGVAGAWRFAEAEGGQDAAGRVGDRA